ncbi:hypothetical protein [Aeromonas media]|uniref:hypothetical protein n=1 Tax=Aeromonas media TaxID=651 RepID=UPI003D0710A6
MGRQQTALVVEWAMRGLSAAGVRDAFMARGVTGFDHCIGVSVEAVNLEAFLAGQQGCHHSVIRDYSCRLSPSAWCAITATTAPLISSLSHPRIAASGSSIRPRRSGLAP